MITLNKLRSFSAKLFLMGAVLIGCLPVGSNLRAASLAEYPPPQEELKKRSQFYGWLPGGTSLEDSGWFAHTSKEVGPHGLAHATYFEENPEFFEIRMSFPTNFQRSYLMFEKSLNIPGLNVPGRVVLRMKRDDLKTGEVKMVVFGKMAYGVVVVGDHIQDIFSPEKTSIPWEYSASKDWHDWVITTHADGSADFSIDGVKELSLPLTTQASEKLSTLGAQCNYLTLGHKRLGVQRTLQVSELHFLSPGETRPIPPPRLAGPADYRQKFSDGVRRLDAALQDGIPNGDVVRFHKNGALWSRGKYADGNKEGIWEYWNEGGRLLGREEFARGKWNGSVQCYSLVDDEALCGVYTFGKLSSPVKKQSVAVSQ